MSGTAGRSRLLLLGGSGLIGTAVHAVFSPDYELLAPSSTDLDLMRPEALTSISHLQFDLAIYTVGYEPPDDSDAELIKTYHLNTRLPARLASLATEKGFTLISFSSDAVFPAGAQDQPYSENDPVAPDSLYSLTKIGAESLLTANPGQAAYVIRLSKVFGPTNSPQVGLLNQMVDSFWQGRDLSLVGDIYKSFTYSLDAARAVRDLVESGRPYGLYHVANTGAASMFEFFSEMSSLIKSGSRLTKISQRDLGSVKKPKTTLLCSKRLPPMRSWQEALAQYCRDRARNEVLEP